MSDLDCALCGESAHARYRHVRTGEWIDVCARHAPTGEAPVTVGGRKIHLHTQYSRGYPADDPSALYTRG